MQFYNNGPPYTQVQHLADLSSLLGQLSDRPSGFVVCRLRKIQLRHTFSHVNKKHILWHEMQPAKTGIQMNVHADSKHSNQTSAGSPQPTPTINICRYISRFSSDATSIIPACKRLPLIFWDVSVFTMVCDCCTSIFFNTILQNSTAASNRTFYKRNAVHFRLWTRQF